MSARGRDRSIEEQLSTLLDYNSPAVLVEEVRAKDVERDDARPWDTTRRAGGLRPSLVWAFAVLILGILSLGIFIEVSPTSSVRQPLGGGSPASSALSDYLQLDQTRAIAGRTVKGNLVVDNPGKPINLTPGTRQVNGQTLSGCEPELAAYVSNSRVTQEIGFATPCSTMPFLIAHGATRLPITLLTDYGSCSPVGQVPTPNNPTCLKSGLPPLPPGRYYAKIEWSQKVVIPNPRPVAFTITATAAPSPGATTTTTTTTTEPVTRTQQFQPWASATSLAPGIAVIGSLSGGNCWTESLPDYDNQYAWRCMAGNVIHDPCFAPPGTTNVTQVACASSPTGGVYLMNLTTGLAQSSSPRTSGGRYAWYVVLSNGQGCSRFDGAGPPTVDGVTLDYACTTGGAADPNRSTNPWIDQYAAHNVAPLEEVTVTQAWN
jgi:hypothetical protein